jgi:hypothetical protein
VERTGGWMRLMYASVCDLLARSISLQLRPPPLRLSFSSDGGFFHGKCGLKSHGGNLRAGKQSSTSFAIKTGTCIYYVPSPMAPRSTTRKASSARIHAKAVKSLSRSSRTSPSGCDLTDDPIEIDDLSVVESDADGQDDPKKQLGISF